MKKSKVKFNKASFCKELTINLVDLQTQLFIDYAEERIRLIGDAIQLYNSRHHFDRTGNLLNSLCWGVAYSGRLKASGFYRDARVKSYSVGKTQSSQSFLHEFFAKYREAYEVDGRYLAERFTKSQGHASGQGYWRVWFAILAPYWGYWEKGFNMKSHFGNRSRRLQFSVMAEFHDKVTEELSPANVKFEVFVPEYSNHSLNYHFKRYQENPKFGGQYFRKK